MRKVALAALALLPTAAFGCTALLGDFEVDATATTPEGGGGDGPVSGDGDTDGGGPNDADPDAFDAQSLVFTSCGINESSIRMIQEVPDAGPGGVGWYGQIQVFRINQSTVRVIAQRNSGGSNGPNDGATVYTFDPKNWPEVGDKVHVGWTAASASVFTGGVEGADPGELEPA